MNIPNTKKNEAAKKVQKSRPIFCFTKPARALRRRATGEKREELAVRTAPEANGSSGTFAHHRLETIDGLVQIAVM